MRAKLLRNAWHVGRCLQVHAVPAEGSSLLSHKELCQLFDVSMKMVGDICCVDRGAIEALYRHQEPLACGVGLVKLKTDQQVVEQVVFQNHLGTLAVMLGESLPPTLNDASECSL